MMKLIFATGNIRKLDEARGILGSGYSLIGAAEAGISEEIPETGDSLEANSRLKAQYVADRLAAFRAGDGAVPGLISGPVPGSVPGLASGFVPGLTSESLSETRSRPQSESVTGFYSGPHSETRSGPVPESTSRPLSEARSEAHSGPVPGLTSGPHSETQSGSVPESTSGPLSETRSGPVPESTSGPLSEAQSEAHSRPVPGLTSGFHSEAQSRPVPESTSGPLSDPDGRDICGCFADDTGLEVELLNGAPGVRSARYAGEAHDDEANMDRLLAEMALWEREASVIRAYGMATPKVSRRARFRTVITLLLDGKQYCFNGIVEGRMACGRRGCHGFGYDPIFVPDEIPAPGGRLVPNTGRLTMAELSEAEKNAISHRGRALRAMAEFLRGR